MALLFHKTIRCTLKYGKPLLPVINNARKTTSPFSSEQMLGIAGSRLELNSMCGFYALEYSLIMRRTSHAMWVYVTKHCAPSAFG